MLSRSIWFVIARLIKAFTLPPSCLSAWALMIFFCPFGMSINELEMKCQELRELQRLIEEAQAEAETIKDAIKAHMGDSETAYTGEYKITWKPVITVRIDTTALKKAMPEVAQAFTRQTTARRFTLA